MSRCCPLLCGVTAYTKVCLLSQCFETGCITPFCCSEPVLHSNGCSCTQRFLHGVDFILSSYSSTAQFWPLAASMKLME
jgi:hypothetical protein